MKSRKNFMSLGSASETPVIDDVSMTQPDMSMSLRQIIEQFAFVGDNIPLGMVQQPEPSLSEDNRLFDSIDVNSMDIQELEGLANELNARAEWMRAQNPVKDEVHEPDPVPVSDDK